MLVTAASQRSQIDELVHVITPTAARDIINDSLILLNQRSSNDGGVTALS